MDSKTMTTSTEIPEKRLHVNIDCIETLRAIGGLIIRTFPGSLGIRIRQFYYSRKFNTCGKSLYLVGGTIIDSPQNVNVGNNVHINSGGCISGSGGVTINDNVIIGQNVAIFASNHIYDDLDIPIRFQKKIIEPVVIKDDVWIGANVTILAGVTIESGCVVGAGAVVTKNIPPLSVAVGNPAKVIKKR